MKKLSIVLVLVIVLSLLCSCGQKGGCKTPEEAATMFVKSVIENDPEAFSQCVHPNMLGEWASSFHISGEDHDNEVTDVHVGGVDSVDAEDLEDIQDDLGGDYNITITDEVVVTVYAKFYEYGDSEEESHSFDCYVMKVGGRWYAWGWS